MFNTKDALMSSGKVIRKTVIYCSQREVTGYCTRSRSKDESQTSPVKYVKNSTKSFKKVGHSYLSVFPLILYLSKCYHSSSYFIYLHWFLHVLKV